MPIKYGKQYVQQKDKAAPLFNAQCKQIQEIVGMLLYYLPAVNPTLACTLSSIATKKIYGTTMVLQACHHLLDYVAMYPNAAIRYVASNMILVVHSDASNLSEPGIKSDVGGNYFFTSDNPTTHKNNAILTLFTIIKHVVSSASAAELASLFYNYKKCCTPMANS